MKFKNCFLKILQYFSTKLCLSKYYFYFCIIIERTSVRFSASPVIAVSPLPILKCPVGFLPFRHAEPHGWFVVGGLCAIPFLLKINKTGCHPVCRARQGLIQFGPNDMWLISCAFFSESFLLDQFKN